MGYFVGLLVRQWTVEPEVAGVSSWGVEVLVVPVSATGCGGVGRGQVRR